MADHFEELANLRTICENQTNHIDELREVVLALSEPMLLVCWCGDKAHTVECMRANQLMKVYRRGKGRHV